MYTYARPRPAHSSAAAVELQLLLLGTVWDLSCVCDSGALRRSVLLTLLCSALTLSSFSATLFSRKVFPALTSYKHRFPLSAMLCCAMLRSTVVLCRGADAAAASFLPTAEPPSSTRA